LRRAGREKAADFPQRIVGDFFVIGECSKPIYPRKPVSPETFDRLRQFRPKIGQPAKKWRNLSDESEIDGVLEPVPDFLGKPNPREFGGKAGPICEPASIKIVWAA
jgi:hypothetical protein